MTQGYVYAIRNKDSGRIKFGQSNAPIERFRALQQATDCELELLGYVAAFCPWDFSATWLDATALESAIHGELSESRERGEWFNPTSPVLQMAARLQRGQADLADFFTAREIAAIVGNEMPSRVMELEREIEEQRNANAGLAVCVQQLEAQLHQVDRLERRIVAAISDFKKSQEDAKVFTG